MFDPSFFELIVICVVALVVLGPDKLPGAIKTLGLWIGRLRRSFNNIKREIEQEVGADEIRRQLRNEAIMEKFNSTKNQVTQSIESVKKEAESVKNDLNLKKQLSEFGTDGSVQADDGDKASGSTDKPAGSAAESDDFDPVEKLATNDPAARVIPDSSSDSASDSGTDNSNTSTGKSAADTETQKDKSGS